MRCSNGACVATHPLPLQNRGQADAIPVSDAQGGLRDKLFVGLDVWLEKTAISVVSEHGKILREAQLASEPDTLLRWISDQDGTNAAVGLEAGQLSEWLHRGLSKAGQPVVLMETRQVKGALKAMPIKTDRRDAEGIALLLHFCWFGTVPYRSMSAQEVRAVLSSRKDVQQEFITLEMSLRGLLRNFGLKAATISRGRFEQRVRELAAGNPMLAAAIGTHAPRAIGAAVRVGGP